MPNVFLSILFANIISSLVSLIGLTVVKLNQPRLQKILIFFVAFAGGTLLGGAFFHLIPEALEKLDINTVNKFVILSFLLFFLLERVLGWHHHHHEVGAEKHIIGWMNLLADALHNFMDGVIIAGAFLTDFNLGVVTSFAVILHEVPQEIGDFAVLLHSGFSVKKAVISNLLVALMSIIGGIIGFYALDSVKTVIPYVTAFAGGGFLYIAAADLLPELRDHARDATWWGNYIVFILGIVLMYFV